VHRALGSLGLSKQSTGETAQGLLPALRVLRIRGFHSWSIRRIRFIRRWAEADWSACIYAPLDSKNQATDWETSENDTYKDQIV